MEREVIVYDPNSGRMIRLPIPQQDYPPPAQYQQYGLPQYSQRQVPAPYFERPMRGPGRRKTRRARREARARQISGMFMLFVASWIPCAFGFPGGTWLIWGAGFSWLLYRWLR